MTGTGCQACPVQNCDTLNYRGSRCIALRAKHGLGDPKTFMDKIQTMDVKELRDFIELLAFARRTPWSEPFEKKFCKNCPSIEAIVQETGQTLRLRECDYADGICPHGDDIIWWLLQPISEFPDQEKK